MVDVVGPGAPTPIGPRSQRCREATHGKRGRVIDAIDNRQRLGRSGRRGGPAVLRVYVLEPAITADTPVHGGFRDPLVRSVAAIDLLLEHWYEPPASGSLHLSTLVQERMSLIAERGGVDPRSAWQTLCGQGPFRRVAPDFYAEFLPSLADAELITQSSDGSLLLAVVGERLVNLFEFYAAFVVP